MSRESLILAGQFRFDGPQWASVSHACKHLIAKLLTVDPRARYTTQQALEHPWFTGVGADDLPPLPPSVLPGAAAPDRAVGSPGGPSGAMLVPAGSASVPAEGGPVLVVGESAASTSAGVGGWGDGRAGEDPAGSASAHPTAMRCTLDPVGRITAVSSAWCNYFGCVRERRVCLFVLFVCPCWVQHGQIRCVRYRSLRVHACCLVDTVLPGTRARM